MPHPPYREDLAYIHDVGFGDLARQAAPFVDGLLRRAGIRAGRVVDLGCGTGITARLLTDAGHEVLGFDLSPAMIARARRRAPAARFRVASFLDAALPRCDAVVSLGECLSYRSDPRHDRRRLGALFRRIHRALRPGGVLLFDLLGPEAPAGSRFVEGDDWAVFAETLRHPRHPLLTRRIVAFRRVAGVWRRHQEEHHLRLHPAAEVVGGLRSAGFRVRRLRGYGSLRLRPGVSGFLARRPGR